MHLKIIRAEKQIEPFKHETYYSVLSAVTPFYIGDDGNLWLPV
jgi:hypothetical protein